MSGYISGRRSRWNAAGKSSDSGPEKDMAQNIGLLVPRNPVRSIPSFVDKLHTRGLATRFTPSCQNPCLRSGQ